MATLTLGGKTVLTQTGSDEPVLGSNLTGSPGFDLSHSLVKKLLKNKVTIKSDIEVFIENND